MVCASVLKDSRIVKAAKGEGRWHENYFRMRERRLKSSVKNVPEVGTVCRTRCRDLGHGNGTVGP